MNMQLSRHTVAVLKRGQAICHYLPLPNRRLPETLTAYHGNHRTPILRKGLEPIGVDNWLFAFRWPVGSRSIISRSAGRAAQLDASRLLNQLLESCLIEL